MKPKYRADTSIMKPLYQDYGLSACVSWGKKKIFEPQNREQIYMWPDTIKVFIQWNSQLLRSLSTQSLPGIRMLQTGRKSRDIPRIRKIFQQSKIFRVYFLIYWIPLNCQQGEQKSVAMEACSMLLSESRNASLFYAFNQFFPLFLIASLSAGVFAG